MSVSFSSRQRLAMLGQYIRPYWRPAVLGIVALLAVNGVGVVLPLLIRTCVDDVQDGLGFGDVVRYSALILGLASVMWVIRMASRVLLFGVGRKVEFDLKQRLFEHLLRLEPTYFANMPLGDLINRATSDVESIRRLVGFAVLSLVNTIFAYVLTLPLMLAIDPLLSLAALAVYPILLLLVQLFSQRLRQEQQDVQEELSEISQLIQEDMSGISLIKIYAQESNERAAFGRLNQKLLKSNLKLTKTRNVLFPLLEGLASFSLLILLWLGGQAIEGNRITVGDLIALILYVERLVFPTALLGFTITAFQRGEVSVDRIEEILQHPPLIQDVPEALVVPPSELTGAIKVDGLTIHYPGQPQPALSNISFMVQPGETIAIVGPIGSGKSTLANALPRLLDVPTDSIFLDGLDITQLSLNSLRRAIAYVPQDSFLFSLPIRDNIRYGNPEVSEAEIIAAAQQAQIDREILNFPRRYDTLVGERGITLSGGQRQRTALARALLLQAPVLILDDALASVDNQTATQILQALNGDRDRQRTVIFISHQLAAAATADRILVLDRGHLVQSGSHRELLATEGLYRSLWERQQLEELCA
ncbi:ABC transporter ATP-binding protein [Synechococcus elongatus]|uniref:ATPase n=2 Tax=Synechococcus elongatus TaxID=32046 RepID=Q31QJ7_SYNE7|nr:ABC transporter ATP-binding protein [Synechococcus elongatus]ABB56672.1 ATPase [Synechococcus elongatus PCC 7942 = FACHB-805]AJD58783.1 membrane protein [Synechococcus elongatus UTEX 2973]MBD2589016.1 ABC transporter ATP-binding protein [Synechococcus elongatus FACHB-242]MBD2690082.1 ABC transporter ATP-binding protein [Synechococcus elongatus FACHB-1061]MBD2708525.1 ABC transporter ATP-binding protein [Synechococcus elongatus PCC 7942 = FACHB-805]